MNHPRLAYDDKGWPTIIQLPWEMDVAPDDLGQRVDDWLARGEHNFSMPAVVQIRKHRQTGIWMKRCPEGLVDFRGSRKSRRQSAPLPITEDSASVMILALAHSQPAVFLTLIDSVAPRFIFCQEMDGDAHDRAIDTIWRPHYASVTLVIGPATLNTTQHSQTCAIILISVINMRAHANPRSRPADAVVERLRTLLATLRVYVRNVAQIQDRRGFTVPRW